jgi:putative DNA primase/helicase
MTEQKEVNITAKNHQELKEKFKGVDIDKFVEKKLKYYRLKPFQDQQKLIWNDNIKEFLILVNNDYKEEEKPVKEKSTSFASVLQSYYTKKDLAKDIFNVKPYFYDNSKIWWLWDNERFKWKIIDDKDILNIVNENSNSNTVDSKEKNEIIEAMQQYGRKRIPKPIKETWIQFKDLIVDIKTGEEFTATPEYFVTNPIPYELHKSRFVETPTMDKIFEEWVGKDRVKTLYEIISYCLLPNYPIHRLFCFIGEGLNGKSCYLKLLKKFIGEDNVTSTELDTLISSRFEVTRLHKKLVCLMGETNFSEMSKTSIIKKLTGQDTIGFEYKNKTPFDGENYAKILIATNNLPTTTDKTIGFYRRWLIIPFLNKFSEKKDILQTIPEEEYEILAVKSLIVLKDLLEKREFHNEGTIEERSKTYEDYSDPLEKFIKEFTEEDVNGFIYKFQFEKRLNDWCKQNKHRQFSEVSIGIKMKERGIEVDKKTSTWLIDGSFKQLRVWRGIKWKE